MIQNFFSAGFFVIKYGKIYISKVHTREIAPRKFRVNFDFGIPPNNYRQSDTQHNLYQPDWTSSHMREQQFAKQFTFSFSISDRGTRGIMAQNLGHRQQDEPDRLHDGYS